MAEQTPNEQSIFLAALEQPTAAERVAFLDQACAENAALRSEVEALLAAHSRLPTASARSAVDLDPPTFLTPPGTIIGRYKILEPIGEGGYGTVFMADQTTPVQRKVALKIIKAGMDTRQVIARFEAERQALALMDHPNIAKVFDAGVTDAGRPYFVMELVKGTPITKYCDEHRLPPQARLELFVQVCQAVQHAHQKGIIHRDLKPSNVLIAQYDGKPVPKVIDFGVAKAAGQQLTERTMFTGFGDVIGTPQYMSPEQAELNQLDVDTRSDIYSLGVLLYELLTGTTPLESKRVKEAALLEVLRVIREEEPPRPSTRLTATAELPSIAAQRGLEPKRLSGIVKGELDWIVMKALEKDRSRRYETANGLAMDVQRYLSDDTVEACPPSASYRLKKFARRYKAKLITASVIGIAVLIAVATVGWSARGRAARQARAAAQIEVVLAEVDQLERDQEWPEALGAARRAEAVLAAGEADAATARRVRERLADLAFVDRLEQISMRNAMTVAGRFDYAEGKQAYARAFREYGVDVEALTVELSVQQLTTRPSLAVPLASALDAWSNAHRDAKGDHNDVAGTKRLIAVARGIDPEPLRDRLRATWGKLRSEARDELRRLAESIDARTQPPRTLMVLARRLEWVGHADDALRIRREARATHPSDFWTNFDLALQLSQQGDHEGAVRFYTAAEAIRPTANAAVHNLGMALRAQGKVDEAIAAYHRALRIQPDDPIAYNSLGLALWAQKKPDEAVDAFNKAIKIDPTFAGAYSNLALVLRDQNKLDLALDACLSATKLKPTYAAYHFNIGLVLDALPGRRDEAIAAYRTAIKLDPRYAAPHAALFDALDAQGKPDEAMEVSDRFDKLNPMEPTYARHFARRGTILLQRNDLDGAIVAYLKAVELDPKNAKYRYNVSIFLQRKGRFGEAIAACEKAVELDPQDAWIVRQLAEFKANCADAKLRDAGRAVSLATAAVSLTPPLEVGDQSQAWQTLGWALYRAGDWKASVAALERSMALQPKPKGGDPGQWFCLAMAHWKLGDKAEARRWYDRSVAWMNEDARPADDWMGACRREAAELLGVTK